MLRYSGCTCYFYIFSDMPDQKELPSVFAQGSSKLRVSKEEVATIAVGQLNYPNGNRLKTIFRNFLEFARTQDVEPNLIALNEATNDGCYVWGDGLGFGLILDYLEQSDTICRATCIVEIEGYSILHYPDWNLTTILQKLNVTGLPLA